MDGDNIREIIRDFYSIHGAIKDCVDDMLPDDYEDAYVDIDAIAKKAGIREIRLVPPGEIPHAHAHLDKKNHVILVNNRDTPEEQHFSKAHEIFHFFTAGKTGDNMKAVARKEKDWKKQTAKVVNADDVEEDIADFFAANLVVPTERFILWEDRTDEEIARVFGVNSGCIRKRREEVKNELSLMAPRDLSSRINLEEQALLSLDELNHALEGRTPDEARRA